MATNYPYMHSSGMIEKVLAQLRNSFPDPFTTDTLKKLGLVPKNESYAINMLRFLGLIDENGKKNADVAKAFLLYDDDEFAKALQGLVEKGYNPLFDHHGERTWKLDRGQIVTFFRQSDGSSDLVGGRQALTFESLARICKRREDEAPRQRPTSRKTAPKKSDSRKPLVHATPEGHNISKRETNVGLTVRIEINLPAQGDKETYDAIFRSIRENFIGAE